MNVYFRQLYDADGIGQYRFRLSIFIACRINLQFRSLSKFAIIVFEETDKEFDRLVAFILNGSTDNAGCIAIQYECLQAHQFGGNGIDWRIRTVFKENGSFFKR